jgi:hypothetical protein
MNRVVEHRLGLVETIFAALLVAAILFGFNEVAIFLREIVK